MPYPFSERWQFRNVGARVSTAFPGLHCSDFFSTTEIYNLISLGLITLPTFGHWPESCGMFWKKMTYVLTLVVGSPLSRPAWAPWPWQREPCASMTYCGWCTAASTPRERPSPPRTGAYSVSAAFSAYVCVTVWMCCWPLCPVNCSDTYSSVDSSNLQNVLTILFYICNTTIEYWVFIILDHYHD